MEILSIRTARSIVCESTEISFKNEMVRCSDFAPSLSVAKEALASNRNLKLLTSKFHMIRAVGRLSVHGAKWSNRAEPIPVSVMWSDKVYSPLE